jgi:hypothetical protein
MAQFIPNDIMNGKNRPKFVAVTYRDITKQDQPRGSSAVERGTHNPEVGGAHPSPATLSPNIILGYN